MTDELLAAIAQRMNRLDAVGVQWDRCVLLDNSGVVYGWIAREDGRSDYVELTFQWGETRDLDDAPVTWLAGGVSTSSAKHSAQIATLMAGDDFAHTDCQRVEDVFGAMVNAKVVLA